MPLPSLLNTLETPEVTTSVLPDMQTATNNVYNKDSLSFLEFRREALKMMPNATNEKILEAYDNYLLRP